MTDEPKTVAERMAETETNPIIREKWIRLVEREKKYVRLFAPLIDKLQKQGAQGTSLQEIVQTSVPFSAEMVRTLLDALPKFDDARAKEAIVRVLCAAATPFDGTALTECYDHTDDEGLRWAILNTIALIKPYSIDNWLSALRNTPAEETLRRLSG